MEIEDMPELAVTQAKAVAKSDEQDKKRRGVMPGKGEDASGSAGPGDHESVDQDFISAVAKLLLWNTQLMRDVVAVNFVTMIVQTNTEPVAKALARGQQYHEIVQREGKDHKRGPPHVLIFREYTQTLVKILGEKAAADQPYMGASENGTVLNDFMNEYIKWPLEQKLTYVKVFRIARIRAEGQKKIIMCLKDDKILQQFLWASEAIAGGQIKLGTMPKTNLERQVQQHIDRMGKSKKGQKKK